MDWVNGSGEVLRFAQDDREFLSQEHARAQWRGKLCGHGAQPFTDQGKQCCAPTRTERQFVFWENGSVVITDAAGELGRENPLRP